MAFEDKTKVKLVKSKLKMFWQEVEANKKYDLLKLFFFEEANTLPKRH